MSDNKYLIKQNPLKRKIYMAIEFIKNKFRKNDKIQPFTKLKSENYYCDVLPFIKKYSELELSKLADIEKKLQNCINENEKAEILTKGIKPEEAEKIIEWVVQSGRKNIFKDEPIDSSLMGFCGYGQGINGETLVNMGINPYILNARETFNEKSAHAFTAVELPIMQGERIEKQVYILDMTYRQFFSKSSTYNGWINDPNFDEKTGSLPGYWLMYMKDGERFSKELLSKGFFKATPENIKLYGDSFVLAENNRDNNSIPPNKKEMITGISGEEYLKRVTSRENEKKIDYYIGELENECNCDLKTPLMIKEELTNNINMQKNNYTNNLKKEKMYDDQRC